LQAELIRLIREKVYPYVDPNHEPFLQEFFKRHPKGLLAVCAYGSRLSDKLASPTSFYDFYLICDNYSRFYPSRLQALWNSFLPPNVYYVDLRMDGSDSPLRSCKYCVISLAHLKREVGPKAKDFYHLGRFSKRQGVVWVAYPEVVDELAQVYLTAAQNVMGWALKGLPNIFSLEELVKKCLILSYEGEVRIEEAPKKVDAIFEAEREYYLALYGSMVSQLTRGLRRSVYEVEDGVYEQRKSPSQLMEGRAALEKLKRRSKRRAKMRWPKQMLTVDDWQEIILSKLERTWGIKIDLTDRQKRLWWIYGWKYFFKLKREGKFK